jgi:hypothetical protein
MTSVPYSRVIVYDDLASGQLPATGMQDSHSAISILCFYILNGNIPKVIMSETLGAISELSMTNTVTSSFFGVTILLELLRIASNSQLEIACENIR